MARLSDIIEAFIKNLLEQSCDQELQIQRNELADKFSCAPSQINYVLTTRFTCDKGYLIESKRGGGGCIVIKKITYDTKDKIYEIISSSIGDSITYHNGVAILESLYDLNIINEREMALIKITINDRTLQNVEDRNKVRADILRSLVVVLLS
ncbi:CtsR family transcriptional regulator [Clostridium manihotivorum]|uniref:Transcriptional regulator CtsR n=1 Tax=Clostridium manihotivorum TaxID=2320868 RepID=A0A410DNZ0_9CLOT|nr:CtsR family transcriptional regulator [Clostridium manihotivorum]QAA30770.1 CtsR family transcriptional regulator [Clostridium manihotivorum]